MRLLTDDSLGEFAQRVANDPKGLDNYRAKRDEFIACTAQKTLDANQRARAALDSVKQGISDATEKLAVARAEQAAAINNALPEALHCPAADLDALAAGIGKWRDRIAFLIDVTEFGLRIEKPKLELEAKRADAELFDCQSEIANFDCEIAAVERAIASRELMRVEGCLVFERVGKTFELLQASWNAFEKAQAAWDAVDAELARQKALANAQGR